MKKFLAFALVLVLAFSMVACKKDDDTTSGTPGTDDPVAKGPSGSLVVGNEAFSGEFFSGWGNAQVDKNIRLLVDCPYLMVQNPDGKLVFAPYVEKRDISADGLTHTFTFTEEFVNGDFKWSDGETITIDDIIFAYDFYMSPDLTEAGGSDSLSDDLESYKVVGDNQIEFKIKQKLYATDWLVFTYGPMHSKHILKDKPADKTVQQHVKDSLISKPVGAGPYKLVEYIEGQYVKLTANEHYMGNYRGAKPSIKDIVIKEVAMETEIDELLVGDVELLTGVIRDTDIDAAKEDPNHTFNHYPRHGFGHLTFQTDFGVVSETAVRQAIAYTIDRESFRSAFIGPYAISTDGPYSTNFWMIDEAWVDNNLTKYTPDKEKANELLQAAGYVRGDDDIYAKDGEKLIINIAAPGQAWVDNLNLVLSEEVTVKDYGIKFNVELIDFSVLLDHYYGKNLDISDRRYHMFALATGLNPFYDGYVNYHSDFIVDPWGSGASTSNSRLRNAEVDQLTLDIKFAEDDDTYANAYRDLMKIFNKELPLIPLYSNDYHDLYDVKLQNLDTNPLWGWARAIVDATKAE